MDGAPVDKVAVAAEYGIRDADLIALIPSRMGIGFSAVCQAGAKEQAERDRQSGNLKTLSPVKKRRHLAGKEIASNELEGSDRGYIHSVLALCALPYRRPPDDMRVWQREYGRSSLVVTSGYLKNPTSGDMELQGIPYGPKARLLMMHLCSQALIQRSRTIELQDSFSAFIRYMGFPVTGGRKGTITQFKLQLNRLAAANMAIGLWDGANAARTIKATPIKEFSVWLPQNPDQKMLWASELTFDHDFYESLRKHALPLDMRSISAFAGSARKLDIIAWLSYRLRGMDAPYLLTWPKVEEQFAQTIQNLRMFRKQFADDINDICEVYSELSLQCQDKGLLLNPCEPKRLIVPQSVS